MGTPSAPRRGERGSFDQAGERRLNRPDDLRQSRPIPAITSDLSIMTTITDTWGPFAPGLSLIEFVSRCRVLGAVGRLLLGSRGDALLQAMREAEDDPAGLDAARTIINTLPSRDMRRILSSYGACMCPGWNA